MAQITEAACLLESGALFTRRVGFQGPKDPVFLGIKHGAFSIYVGDMPYFHFDLEGRWQRALIDGMHFLKGLDTTVRAVDRVREGANLVLKRRILSFAETADLDATIRNMALDLIAETEQGTYPRLEPPTKKGVEPISPEEARAFLERIASWDAAAWFAHRENYLATYGPTPFIPPEFNNPLIVQTGFGRGEGRAFGGGEVEPPAYRTPEEFATHVERVRLTLGRRASQSRQVFLAGEETFRLPSDTVASFLKTVDATFPIPETVHRGRAADGDPNEELLQLDGIAAFLDEFAGPRPTAEDWKRFRSLKLKFVTLGIESGSPSIRAGLGRRWVDADLVALIEDLHAADIRVGLAVVANLGDASDRAATAELVKRLPLAKGELVSLLDVNELGGRSTDDWDALVAEWKTALGDLKPKGVKVFPYSVEKQWN